MFEYIISLAILFAIYAILGISLNLIVGYTGLISLAHAGFYGIGAYTTAILLTKFGMNFFASLFLGILFAAIIALLMGLVLSKFNGDYYVLCSLGFNAIVFSVLMNWQEVTRGALGIPGIARPKFFSVSLFSSESFLIMTLLCLLAVYGISVFITKSSFGRVLKAIREDEKAIQIFGYNTQYYKLVIFIIGSSLAAIAGSLFASYISYIDPTTFNIAESVYVLSIIILGGLANLRGSVLGALFLIVLPELLRFVGFPSDVAAQMRQLTYGLLLILLMLYRPQGLMGEYKL